MTPSTGRATIPLDLYHSRPFADLWYGARAAGERIRAIALERLYRNRPRPGGPHPDPRGPSAFSSRAVLSISATLLGLRISPTILAQATQTTQTNQANQANQAAHADQPGLDVDEETGRTLPSAWIVIYPHSATPAQGQAQRQPEIVLRSLHANQRLMEHEIACLLGYWHHEHVRLTDPDAPAGTILLPRDPGVTALLHQYTIALLCLPKACPPAWTCHCNTIRARFNAPPPDHETPTGAYTVEDLEREAQRPRTDTEPHFPYRDTNPWTE